MEIHTKIRELIADKENFKVENGKVFLKDMFGDWCERVANSLGVIDVRGFKFTMADVEVAISGKIEVLEITPQAYEGKPENKIEIDELTTFGKREQTPIKKKITPIKRKFDKAMDEVAIYEHKRASNRSAQIKLIRKMLADKKKPAAIAKALNTTLHSVMYVVKKIKNGEKLKFEK